MVFRVYGASLLIPNSFLLRSPHKFYVNCVEFKSPVGELRQFDYDVGDNENNKIASTITVEPIIRLSLVGVVYIAKLLARLELA